MKRFSFVLMASALAVLLAVDVTYFCSNSAVLSQLNASSSSSSSSVISSSSEQNTPEPNSTSSSASASSSLDLSSSGVSGGVKELGTIVKYVQSGGKILKTNWRTFLIWCAIELIWKSSEEQIGEGEVVKHLAWVTESYEKSRTYYPNGQVKEIVYGQKRKCSWVDGDGEPECSPAGTEEIID